MKMYLREKWLILRTSFSERLAYRTDFVFATLVRFLPIVTQILLWKAVYDSRPDSSQSLNSYTYSQIVAYYLLVMVGRAFSSMPGLTGGIARDIRDGTIKKFLTQPIDLLDFLFWHRVAHKLVYYVMAIGPFALVFWLCRSYFPPMPSIEICTAMACSLILGFLIGFLIEAWLGLVAFWFLEVSSLVFVYMLLNYFLSGHMIPLEWMPSPLSEVVNVLPFRFLAFVPAAIWLGKYTPAECWRECVVGVVWVVVLLGLNRWTLQQGIRRYSAYGG